MSDEQLSELFEVETTKQRLADAERDMKGIVEKFFEQESVFAGYASDFSKISAKELDF